jgi:hypothetical protein
VREKIKQVYMNKFSNMKDAIATCSKLEEELTFRSVRSRLEYFKRAVQYGKFLLTNHQSREIGHDNKNGASVTPMPPSI